MLFFCCLLWCIVLIFGILTFVFILAVWKSAALWTVVREKNSQQINGWYLYSL